MVQLNLTRFWKLGSKNPTFRFDVKAQPQMPDPPKVRAGGHPVTSGPKVRIHRPEKVDRSRNQRLSADPGQESSRLGRNDLALEPKAVDWGGQEATSSFLP